MTMKCNVMLWKNATQITWRRRWIYNWSMLRRGFWRDRIYGWIIVYFISIILLPYNKLNKNSSIYMLIRSHNKCLRIYKVFVVFLLMTSFTLLTSVRFNIHLHVFIVIDVENKSEVYLKFKLTIRSSSNDRQNE